MAKEIKTKKSFGSVRIDRFNPAVPDGMPKALNVKISFEEAMRLHLGLGQALAKLNSYDRSTKAGKRSAVNLCVFLHKNRLTINEDTVDESKNRREDRAAVSSMELAVAEVAAIAEKAGLKRK